MAELYEAVLLWTTRGIELAGVAVIVVGAVVATTRFLREAPGSGRVRRYRRGLGEAILLGLEFLVAADIIATIAIDLTLQSVLVLAAIVLVRTFLSMSLQLELEGRWPWQKAEPGDDAG